MSATTYYAATAAERLAEAQRTLDTHITSSATGRCLACGTLGPCYKRENAVVIFSREVGTMWWRGRHRKAAQGRTDGGWRTVGIDSRMAMWCLSTGAGGWTTFPRKRFRSSPQWTDH